MIPAGYQLHIESWENDGDARKTEIMSGLTVEDVKFVLEICSQFKSKNSFNKSGGRNLGNGDVDGAVLLEVLSEALENHPNISQTVREQFTVDEIGHDGLDEDDAEYMAYEIITENLLGRAENEYYDGMFCRVFDRFKVYHYETPVEEVTAQFR